MAGSIRRRAVSALGCALLSACAGWQRLEAPTDTTLAPRQQVQVWHGGRAQVLHAVRLTADTLFGIPFMKPPSCDSCVIAQPLAAVDSLRLGDQEFPAITTIVLILGGGLLLLYGATRGLSDLAP